MVTAAAWVDGFIDRVHADHTVLTALDTRAGDGDFGDNLLSAAARARREREAGTPPFRALVQAFRDAGGTSGPLLGMWFRPFARELQDPVDAAALARAAREGLAAIQSAAGAQVGDNTMVDAMAPAADALADAADRGSDAPAALAAAARAAAEGAASTEGLLGRKGRSSYVGDHALGVADPGAVAIAWFFEAGRDAQ
ncbi:hypothetical protein ASF40_16045 [Microbacterium sp. Leaf288]|uniref:DAK2 domain-containing protein n=1 Tax=Microbacterium sp. Leaf288 TaxID=1736323 RepID=UPI00070183B1|nr:DAK2 domain-containing protein [Microbacterium sp. Leaf288]KQP69718.1 hypothetical protein ASF40_16045 [Microbacterium sp. Leaf288]